MTDGFLLTNSYPFTQDAVTKILSKRSSTIETKTSDSTSRCGSLTTACRFPARQSIVGAEDHGGNYEHTNHSGPTVAESRHGNAATVEPVWFSRRFFTAPRLTVSRKPALSLFSVSKSSEQRLVRPEITQLQCRWTNAAICGAT